MIPQRHARQTEHSFSRICVHWYSRFSSVCSALNLNIRDIKRVSLERLTGRGGGAWCVCVYKQRGRGEVFALAKIGPPKNNAFLWLYFWPKLVACLPAFAKTTPIVRAETWAFRHYIQISGVNGEVHTAQEWRRRDQKDMRTSGHKRS